jgi:outer membrane protein
MNNKTIIFICSIFILPMLTCPVYGQVSDTAKKWTIQDCFQYASAHNIQINSFRLNQQSAEQDLLASKGAKIPSLSASVGNNFNNGNNRPLNNGSLVNQLTTSGSYSVNSSVVLWNDDYINNTILQRNMLTQSAGLLVQQTENNITLSIAQAYLDVLLSKENEKYIIDLVNTGECKTRANVI